MLPLLGSEGKLTKAMHAQKVADAIFANVLNLCGSSPHAHTAT